MEDESRSTVNRLAHAVAEARAAVAAAEARLATACLRYADARTADEKTRDDRGPGPKGGYRPRRGEFVADELSVLLAEQPWDVRLLLSRSRRLRRGLPTVWRAAHDGEVDGQRLRLIDRAARLATEPSTVAVLNEESVDAARTRTPRQLKSWLDRLLAELEPGEYHRRHARAFNERRVTTSTSCTGMGYVTGEVSSAAAAAIDLRLSILAQAAGSADPRTLQQRRSDLFAGLLLGQQLPMPDPERAADSVETEIVDPDTGEVLGTRSVRSEDSDSPRPDADAVPATAGGTEPTAPEPSVTLGVIVPVSTLLGTNDRPAELADRSGCVPADVVRRMAEQPGTLFYRLLTDDRGGLLDVTELGRFPSGRLAEAVRFRAGVCTFPSCSVPAALCDIDHHEPYPVGRTRAAELDPLCRRHHRGKTFAGLASRRDENAVVWTLPFGDTYRCLDERFPRRRAPDPGIDPEWFDPSELPELAEVLIAVEAAA